jgi:hypothetical protein
MHQGRVLLKDLDSLVVCLNQFFRPKTRMPVYLRPKGVGDCMVCSPDWKNRECAYYFPIRVWFYTVEDNYGKAKAERGG